MLVKRLRDCAEFTANDGCRLRELLHPKVDPVDLPYSIAVATVDPGTRTYKHKLDREEVYYILSGAGEMHIGDEVSPVAEGDAAHVPAGAVQWLENTGPGPLRFMAIVNPPWGEEGDERIS